MPPEVPVYDAEASREHAHWNAPFRPDARRAEPEAPNVGRRKSDVAVQPNELPSRDRGKTTSYDGTSALGKTQGRSTVPAIVVHPTDPFSAQYVHYGTDRQNDEIQPIIPSRLPTADERYLGSMSLSSGGKRTAGDFVDGRTVTDVTRSYADGASVAPSTGRPPFDAAAGRHRTDPPNNNSKGSNRDDASPDSETVSSLRGNSRPERPASAFPTTVTRDHRPEGTARLKNDHESGGDYRKTSYRARSAGDKEATEFRNEVSGRDDEKKTRDRDEKDEIRSKREQHNEKRVTPAPNAPRSAQISRFRRRPLSSSNSGSGTFSDENLYDDSFTDVTADEAETTDDDESAASAHRIGRTSTKTADTREPVRDLKIESKTREDAVRQLRTTSADPRGLSVAGGEKVAVESTANSKSTSLEINRAVTSDYISSKCIPNVGNRSDEEGIIQQYADNVNDTSHLATTTAGPPDGVLVHVFKYLDVLALCRTALVCRKWLKLSRDPNFWKTVTFRDANLSSKVREVQSR